MRQEKMMSDLRYCVRFIRKDHAKPSEEDYYYWDREDAEAHFNLFKEQDPDYPKMYSRIQLISMYGQLSTVSDEICLNKELNNECN